LKVGVLALQGSFLDHCKSLDICNFNYVLIKRIEDLENIDSLIIPGGESTAMKVIQREQNLFNEVDKVIKKGLPTLTTCAGTILLAKEVVDGETCIPNLDIKIQRNAYGRQNQSFEGDVEFLNNSDIYCFIRAPKIISILTENVKPIAFHNNDVVGVQQHNVVGLTYHPELTNDSFYIEWLKQYLKSGEYVGTF